MMGWQRLLALDTQPSSIRECYELLEDFVVALRRPAPEFHALRPSEKARLGYFIAAARMVGGLQAHPEWKQLQARLRAASAGESDLILLRCDDGFNASDELAHLWGFRKGLDSMKLVQLGAHGAT
jgi:hypothetical protein